MLVTFKIVTKLKVLYKLISGSYKFYVEFSDVSINKNVKNL